ncbi:MAG: hypothetical protein ACYTBJ_19930, partial [Planctomycetota bacterium]
AFWQTGRYFNIVSDKSQQKRGKKLATESAEGQRVTTDFADGHGLLNISQPGVLGRPCSKSELLSQGPAVVHGCILRDATIA